MADDYSGFVPWVLAGIGGIVSTLLGGVVTLFRMRESDQAKQLAEHKGKIAELEVKSDKCEEDRAKLFTKCEVHSQEIRHQSEEIERLKTKIAWIDTDGTKYSHRRDAT